MSLKYRELLVNILKLHRSTNLKIFPEKVNFTIYMTHKKTEPRTQNNLNVPITNNETEHQLEVFQQLSQRRARKNIRAGRCRRVVNAVLGTVHDYCPQEHTAPVVIYARSSWSTVQQGQARDCPVLLLYLCRVT